MVWLGHRLSAAGLALVLVAGSLVGLAAAVPSAHADEVTASQDNLRTGWDQNEPNLTPAKVSASDFGQLFSTAVDGQVYAQPIVADGVLLAVTENDQIYGLNPQTGAILWQRNVGPFWPASTNGCGDLVPNIGSTATPVYDPSTGTAYFTAKVNDGPDAMHPHWYMHAVDIQTGAERPGFPAIISGSPSNDPSDTFDPATAMQRPGLLLLGGVVYAGFASHCDFGPYVGYVAGVNATTGVQTALWATEGDSSNGEAGIWQSGGGLVSDGPGQIIFTTGNGVSPAPGPGDAPPIHLAESVVRLQVNANGSLTAKDFFSPVNNTSLDQDDADLGSGGPLAIPDGYGTTQYPHLLVQVGKDGRVFLLDRDDLGGDGQSANGNDKVLDINGAFNGVWGHPAFYGGDTGYVYDVENAGYLRAFKVGTFSTGTPSLSSAATSTGTWGYTSGSPVVTSVGTDDTTAVVWAVYADGSSGANGQLRAYSAIPNGQVLPLIRSFPIGTAAKFSVPATSGGRVYVGTRDGHVEGFGAPVQAALTGPSTVYGSVTVGASSTQTVTLTATTPLTINTVTAPAPFSVGAVTLPESLAAGSTLQVPVTFAPTVPGEASGALAVGTSAGSFAFSLDGSGTQPGLSASPSSLAFGQVPTTGHVTLSVSISNSSTATETITGATGPSAPFAAGSLPTIGSTLAPGASVTIPVTMSPTTTGTFASTLSVTSNSGGITVGLSGTGVSGAGQLTLTPKAVDFGAVPIGQSVTKTFTISDTGNLSVTITKAAPPSGAFTTATPVSEGQQLNPGDVIVQSVTFAPTALGAATGAYLITGNDSQGHQQVNFTGTGLLPLRSIPVPYNGGWQLNGTAVQQGPTTVLTFAGTAQAGSAVYPVAISPTGLHVHFTASLTGGTGADGLAFALVDASTTKDTALGSSGGALGWAPLPGVAVTLDTYQNAGDPSSNFIGIATGSSGTQHDSLNYVATEPAATPLTSGTQSVDITVSGSTLSVVVDGGTPLTATVTLPNKAFLYFSAGTGGLTDRQAISAVTITTPPAVGPIGSASGCVAAPGTAPGLGTLLAVQPCQAVADQTWTRDATDGRFRVFGVCMATAKAGTAAGTAVLLASCSGFGVVWLPQRNGTLINQHSGLCLNAVTSGSTTSLDIAACSTAASERFTLPT